MNSTARTTGWLPLFVAGVALALGGLMFNTAAADGASGTLSGLGAGQEINTGGSTHWAGLIHLTLDGGGTLDTYCIDLGTSTTTGVHYSEGPWSEANVSNLGMVTWVLGHGYPNVSTSALATSSGAGSLTSNQAAAATQAAVWHFSDSKDLDPASDASILAVYNYLVTNAVSVSEPPATLTVTPAALQGTVGDRIGPFTVTTSAATVTLTATGGTITDAVGTPLMTVSNGDTFYVTMAAAGSVTVTAEATATLSSGRVFLTTATSPKQKLITASTTSAMTSVEVSATSNEATTTTEEATTTTTEAVTTTTEVGSEGPTTTTQAVTTTTQLASGGPTTTVVRSLPHTGSTSGGMLLTALGLTLVGISLAMVARRRLV